MHYFLIYVNILYFSVYPVSMLQNPFYMLKKQDFRDLRIKKGKNPSFSPIFLRNLHPKTL